MKVKKVFSVLLLLILSFMITSCGSGSGNGAGATGGAVILSTSVVSANANSSSIDADISPDTATGLIHRDTVSVIVDSNITGTSGTKLLPVQVGKVTVSYSAKNGGPFLADEVYYINNTIDAGSTFTFTVDAATLNQKVIINAIYPGYTLDYDVRLVFDVSEIGFGQKSGSPATYTTVHFGRFKDS